MSNLAKGTVILKFINPILMQKSSSSLYSNFVLNLYIVFRLNNWPHNPTNNLPLKSFLFGTVKLIRNEIKSTFIYNDWGIAFDGEGSWSFGNVIIFSVNNSPSCHIDNPKNNF